MRREWVAGRQRGLRVIVGPIGAWASLGIHVHAWPLREAHIDLHLPWLWIGIGRHWGVAS